MEGKHMANLDKTTVNTVASDRLGDNVMLSEQPVSIGSTQATLPKTVVRQRPLRIGGQSPLFSPF